MRRSAVRDVAREVRVRLRGLAEPFELLLRVDRIGVGGRQVGHQPDDVRGRLWQLGESPAAHPGIELEMNGDAGGDLATGDDELEPRLARLGHLLRRAHHDDSRLRELATQLAGFGEGHDAEGRRAGFERRPRDVACAVAVAVRLDDGPELAPVEPFQQPSRVMADRAEVNRDLAPLHGRPA